MFRFSATACNRFTLAEILIMAAVNMETTAQHPEAASDLRLLQGKSETWLVNFLRTEVCKTLQL
jgi:hypothetical protein